MLLESCDKGLTSVAKEEVQHSKQDCVRSDNDRANAAVGALCAPRRPPSIPLSMIEGVGGSSGSLI